MMMRYLPGLAVWHLSKSFIPPGALQLSRPADDMEIDGDGESSHIHPDGEEDDIRDIDGTLEEDSDRASSSSQDGSDSESDPELLRYGRLRRARELNKGIAFRLAHR